MKTAYPEIEANGKKYRCMRKPDSRSDAGAWEFMYNNTWHEVKSYQIRHNLNLLAGFIPNQLPLNQSI